MVDMLFSLIKDLIFGLFFSSFGRGAKIHFFVIWQGLGYFFSANTFVKKQSSLGSMTLISLWGGIYCSLNQFVFRVGSEAINLSDNMKTFSLLYHRRRSLNKVCSCFNRERIRTRSWSALRWPPLQGTTATASTTT